MSFYSDDGNEFDSFSEEEIDQDIGNKRTPLEVNVVSKTKINDGLEERTYGSKYGSSEDESSAIKGDLLDSDDEIELHGKGDRMKLSKKPPEVLLRQYRQKISSCIEVKNVS